jgi:hypothetical protein
VVRHARRPRPEEKGDDKLLVWGATEAGDLVQIIFVLKQPDELEFDALDIEQWRMSGTMTRLFMSFMRCRSRTP